jgi:hypothetical protein
MTAFVPNISVARVGDRDLALHKPKLSKDVYFCSRDARGAWTMDRKANPTEIEWFKQFGVAVANPT